MKRRKLPKFKPIKKTEKREDVVIKMKDFYKVITASLIVFSFAYLGLNLISGNASKKTEEPMKKDVEYNRFKILASETFKKKETEYYVLFYNFNEDNKYQEILNDSEITVYQVDTEDKLNKKYITTTNSNQTATSLEELKVKEPTLIKIEQKQIVSYLEDEVMILLELENN